MSAISECEQLPLSSTKLPGLKKICFGIPCYIDSSHTDFIHLDCSQDTVYGRRDGALTGLAVVHRDKGNAFPTTKGFRLGVVHDVAMLPRAMMYKPHASYMQNLFPHMQMWYPTICTHFRFAPFSWKLLSSSVACSDMCLQH